VKLATFTLAGDAQALFSDREQPVVLQTACGLGHVVVVAFDLDTGPFTDKEFAAGQHAVWTRLLADCFDLRPAVAANANPNPNNPPPNDERKELADQFQEKALEEFGPEVPTVSFGWVALFIVLYILVVGPLDYFLLKKVFKRLELTWITFPLVVIVCSIAAYWTAYALKGEDLCTNQVDVIEYDLRSGQVFGHGYFTLFSPRLQDYTVNVEAAPGWALKTDDEAARPMVAALAGPARSSRQGSQALFRQPYAYAEGATGVDRVPVPVWATRSFQASWRGALDPGKPAVVASVKLKGEKDPRPAGSITSNLPVPLREVVVFWRGKAYPLNKVLPDKDPLLRPGQPVAIDQAFDKERVNPVEPEKWLVPLPADGSDSPKGPEAAYPLLQSVLFHSVAAPEKTAISGLRGLDQGWRLRRLDPSKPESPLSPFRNELILVGHTGPRAGKADSLTADGAVPTRIQLVPPLTGYLNAETVVRVYIPLS
jgi:hypothetical protein